MSSSAPRHWGFYITDMVRFAGKVIEYTSGLNQASFVANGLVYDACLRNLELIGEAASKIPDSVRTANPVIPWRQFVATRNRLIHGYLGIDDDIVWNIIEQHVPELILHLKQMVVDDQ